MEFGGALKRSPPKTILMTGAPAALEDIDMLFWAVVELFVWAKDVMSSNTLALE